ncbi:MAG TPA: hypothetical protein DCW68_02850 [Rhodospirillaceae bacterium]|nr:MAG: hypothetical protein A2018_05820 [Alphaproteobacteria bacterium GWF2_58_20]HAU29030.1 hypothetical protein [Rhodospirillaceae bacterium]
MSQFSPHSSNTSQEKQEALAEALTKALFNAAKDDDGDMVRNLVRKGANPDRYSTDLGKHTSPLHETCLNGRTKAAVALLECGANPDHYSYSFKLEGLRGASPLHIAAFKGNLPLVCALLEADANPHSANVPERIYNQTGGRTALHFAAIAGHADVVKRLLAHGLFPSTNDAAQETPLHLACKNGHVGCAALLIEAGANPNARNSTSNAPLHYACNNGDAICASLLIQAGANPNMQPAQNPRMQDHDGNSPLHLAAAALHEGKDSNGNTVQILVAGGADPIVFNRHGKRPESHLAHPEEIRIFRKAVEEGLKLRKNLAEHKIREKTESLTLTPANLKT